MADKCSVCLESMSEAERSRTHGTHRSHCECLRQWFAQIREDAPQGTVPRITCPECRAVLSPAQEYMVTAPILESEIAVIRRYLPVRARLAELQRDSTPEMDRALEVSAARLSELRAECERRADRIGAGDLMAVHFYQSAPTRAPPDFVEIMEQMQANIVSEADLLHSLRVSSLGDVAISEREETLIREHDAAVLDYAIAVENNTASQEAAAREIAGLTSRQASLNRSIQRTARGVLMGIDWFANVRSMRTLEALTRLYLDRAPRAPTGGARRRTRRRARRTRARRKSRRGRRPI